MTLDFSDSSFPLPEEIIEKLQDLEKRIQSLEKEKIEIHKVGMPSALSEKYQPS